MELSSTKSRIGRISPPARILLAMIAGAAVGLALGPRVAGRGSGRDRQGGDRTDQDAGDSAHPVRHP